MEKFRYQNDAWKIVKKPNKAEYNVRHNYFQSVREESTRVQGFTIEMQGVPQLLPNKIWKQLNQYSKWKFISTKASAGFSSKKQLNWEFNLRPNWFQNFRNESCRFQGFTIDLPQFSQLLPNKFENNWTGKQLKNHRYKYFGWNFAKKPTECGI